MSIRETFSERSRLGIGIAAALLIAAAIFVYVRLPHGAGAAAADNQAFFTIDDGKTWFADDASKLAPFTRDGKQAVRAYVYRCADGTEFVNHLERYKPEAKVIAQEADKPIPGGKGMPNLAALQTANASGREVKRPGDAKWLTTGTREAAQVTAVKPPKPGEATPVEP